jgi:bifunctional DNA-binding transcriptional regulator/antitoxin component of YhaV-PrlF toxin-antitoxin module
MARLTTTVTSKRQVTIPKELDKDFPVKPGMRLTWAVENDALVARRARSIAELAGCLRTGASFPGLEAEKQAIARARATHCLTSSKTLG